MNLANLTMLASIMASLVAVPAVSTTMSSDLDATGALVSGTSEEAFSDSPREYSTTVATDGVERTIDTPGGEASFSITNDKFEAVLDRPGEMTRLVQKAGTMERQYEGNGVAVTSSEDSTGTVMTCETPEGKITNKQELGDQTEQFKGIDRQTVESTCDQARDRLSSRAERIASIAMEFGVLDEQVEITHLNASKEAIELTNNGPIPVNLTDWTISDSSGISYTFEDAVLDSGEALNVYSADANDDCTEYCWSSGYIWAQDGDTARLDDPNGDRVDTFSYEG